MTSPREQFHKLLEAAWQAADRPPMRELAEATGRSHSALHGAIRGRSMPSRDTLISLINALGVSETTEQRLVELHDEANDRRHSHGQVPTTGDPIPGTAYLVLKDGEVHDVIFNDQPMALRQAEGEKGVLVALPILRDFRERE